MAELNKTRISLFAYSNLHIFFSVEQRRRLLELSVLFYSHTEELTHWLTELKVELQSEEVAESLEGAERLLEQFGAQRDSTLGPTDFSIKLT